MTSILFLVTALLGFAFCIYAGVSGYREKPSERVPLWWVWFVVAALGLAVMVAPFIP